MSAAITALVVDAVVNEALAHGVTAAIVHAKAGHSAERSNCYGTDIVRLWSQICNAVEVELVSTVDRGLVGLVVDEWHGLRNRVMTPE